MFEIRMVESLSSQMQPGVLRRLFGVEGDKEENTGSAEMMWPDWLNLVPDCPIGSDWKIHPVAQSKPNLEFSTQSAFSANQAFPFWVAWDSRRTLCFLCLASDWIQFRPGYFPGSCLIPIVDEIRYCLQIPIDAKVTDRSNLPTVLTVPIASSSRLVNHHDFSI